VYPDDAMVDTFEELLAEVEVSNARIYWTNVWKAGGDDGEKRGAWRSLEKSHGAGRAHWIINQVTPTNPQDEPVKAAGDHLLVVVTEAPLADSEKPAVETYWADVFQAGNDQTAQQAAFDTLVAALGRARAEVVVSDYVPQNLTEPVRNAKVISRVRVVHLELPTLDQIATQLQPWMHAANTALLPERFVVIAFNDGKESLRQIGTPIPSQLIIGPNPTAKSVEQLRLEDGELVVPDELSWIVDFDSAVANGMGFRINLTPEQTRRGFDRLFVLGIRLSADAETSRSELENLIQHHQRSRKGFSVLPQGAPTNNVEDETSGYSWLSDSDASYDHYFVQDATDDPEDWRRKKDGRWLAEYLGVEAEVLKASPNYFATDQCEARAMNEALWPATLGYFMEKMMTPVFSASTRSSTRAYFNRYVIGRGTLPAFRIGRQPYGILPAAPFSRMAWLRREILSDDRLDLGISNQFNYLTDLYRVLRTARETWTSMIDKVSYVGKPNADPQQTLLDVVGLHPSSVEFYQRFAESAEQLYNRFKLSGVFSGFLAAIITLAYQQSGMSLLNTLGYDPKQGDELPETLTKFFLKAPNLLKGPLIDDVPLSETDPIRVYHTDGSNYLAWLIAAARDSHDTLRKQAGFIDERPPTALLYQMLRHAIDIGFVDTALTLHHEAQLLTDAQLIEAQRPLKFMHIEEAEQDKGSEWQYLYKTEPLITNDAQIRLAEFIPQILISRNPYLNTQLSALEHLRDAPTARLERAFAEHIDCCTSRLDAWLLGIVNVQLELMRQRARMDDGTEPGEGKPPARGLYLGAFGWLEDVRSERKALQSVQLSDELAAIFAKESAPLVKDPTNFGFIHAPSLNHAVTAAVLRNGYLANATPNNPDSLSINLTSARVRLALNVIEGIRGGQSLAALLGYYLERGLHDHEGLFLDSLIFELRKQFPLAGDRLKSTRTDDNVAIEVVEARNVVDGLALIEHVKTLPEADRSYPFNLGDKLPEVTDPAALAAIDAEVERIANINDAVADLAMAEGMYQVVQGNYDRAAATMDAYSKGHFPPIPEVVQTPRSGVTLTHRVAIHLKGGLDPNDAGNATARAKAEPAINAWLGDLMPPMDQVVCGSEYFNHGNNADETQEVTCADLGLLPADLLYMLDPDGEQQMRALDDQVLLHVLATPGLRADVDVRIRYRVDVPGKFSFFELAPYLANLRALLLRSRALKATDARMPNEAAATEESTAAIRESKVTLVRDMLNQLNLQLTGLKADLDTKLGDPDEEVMATNAIDEVDEFIADYADVAGQIGRFGLPGTGVGFAYDWRRQQFTTLLDKLGAVIGRWERKLALFDQRLLDYANLPGTASDNEKMTLLLHAAMLITTQTVDPPVSGDPNDLLLALNTTLRPAFISVLDDLRSARDTETTVSGLYKNMDGKVSSIAAHDTEPLVLTGERTAIIAFAKSLQSKTSNLSLDVTNRLAEADALIAGDPGADNNARIEELQGAVKRLLGSDFVILPEFALGAEHIAEWRNTYNDRATLLGQAKNVDKIDFPEDDWMYGIARVREKMHHLEGATTFADALIEQPIDLTPLQFPYRTDDTWLALKTPETHPVTGKPFTIDEDKLLYTAHYHGGFDHTAAQHCGVLLDEWTEVIPTREETTGLTFHYDRPNSEPPQSLLLALPADFTGQWNWQDLVDTLHETLELARQRAVEPQHLDETPYARFLPTVLSSLTTLPIALTLNYAFNNAVQFQVEDTL
jgi:hypothetical protein